MDIYKPKNYLNITDGVGLHNMILIINRLMLKVGHISKSEQLSEFSYALANELSNIDLEKVELFKRTKLNQCEKEILENLNLPNVHFYDFKLTFNSNDGYECILSLDVLVELLDNDEVMRFTGQIINHSIKVQEDDYKIYTIEKQLVF